MGQRKLELIPTFKQGILTWTGLTIGGIGIIGAMDFLGFGLAGKAYLFPPIAVTGIVGSVVGLEGMLRLTDMIGLRKRVRFPAFTGNQFTEDAPYPVGRRGYTVNGKRTFLRTVQNAFMGYSDDPEVTHRTVDFDKWLKPETPSWTVYLADSRKPIIITHNYLYTFLSLAWDRQQQRETGYIALSRNHFVRDRGYSFREYYSLINLVAHSIAGRGEGESGYLMATPHTIIRRTAYIYPPFKPVRF